ncbi:MAG: hypothetical protein HZT43_09315 [Exiguobacterium profundum]|nr:MAG: hypothetical protein HZT43_09315 [Exiguobacterium profundum]
MTIKGFKIAALLSVGLFASSFSILALACLDNPYQSSCLDVEPLVNLMLVVAVFSTFVFVFIPLVLTFIGVPLAYNLYRYKYGMSGRLTKDDVDFFLVIQEWL